MGNYLLVLNKHHTPGRLEHGLLLGDRRQRRHLVEHPAAPELGPLAGELPERLVSGSQAGYRRLTTDSRQQTADKQTKAGVSESGFRSLQ